MDRISAYRMKAIKPDETQHYKNILKIEKEKEMRSRIKTIAKKIAIGTAAAMLFAAKALKAEGPMISSQPATLVSSSTIRSQPLNLEISTQTKKEEVQFISSDNITNINIMNTRSEKKLNEKSNHNKLKVEGKQDKYEELKINDNYKNVSSQSEILSCLSSNDESCISNYISRLLDDEMAITTAVRHKIKDLVLTLDPFYYPLLMEVIKMHKIDEAVPNIIKRLGLRDESVQSDQADINISTQFFESSVYALGVFAVKGDWNAINSLLEILEKSKNNENKAVVAAILLYVDKNVMQEIKSFYKTADEETRSKFARTAIMFQKFDLELNSFNSNKVIKRLESLESIEQNSEIKDLLYQAEPFTILTLPDLSDKK